MSRSFLPRLSAVLLLLAATGVAATEPVAQLMEQAESLRTAEPSAFAGLLDRIDKRRNELTPAQREELAYLQIYRQGYGGNYEAVIPKLKKLSVSSTDSDTRFRAGSLLVNVYTKTRRFTDALRQLSDNLGHIEEVRNPEFREHLLVEAAYLHNQIGQYRLGLQYAERILERQPSQRTRCFADYLKFDALLNQALLPADDQPLLDSIAECEKAGERIVANTTRTILARKWVTERRRDDAIALLRRHLPAVEAARYPYQAVLFKSLLAELMMDKGDLRAAESYASETIAFSGTVGNTRSLVSAYRTLYRIAERRRDGETALVYYRRYAEVDKAYLDEVKARELAYQIVRQESLEKTQQIQRLDSQNQLLKLQRQLEREASRNTRLAVVLLAMLLASMAFWAYKTKRMQVSFKRLAEIDTLTGVCNRHHFTRQAERTLAQCARSGEQAALIMFDLDHFKGINDRFGHATGDAVLEQVAAVCHRLAHRGDTLGRLGGEEFALLVRGRDLTAAIRTAEECRRQVAAMDTQETGYRFPVSASFGVASTALSGYPLARLLSHADNALYHAKHTGRNRVSAHDGHAAVEVPHETAHSATREAAAEARRGETPLLDGTLEQASP